MATTDGGLALPGDFLPVAEEHGLVRAIDGWVIRRGRGIAGTGHRVQFNLSAASLADAGLATRRGGRTDGGGRRPAGCRSRSPRRP